jgi:hypothetical protein
MFTYRYIEFQDDIADEFDVSGFLVCTKENWEARLKELEEFFKNNNNQSATYYVGTNFDKEYSSARDVLSQLKVKEISEDRGLAIITTVGSCKFGYLPIICDNEGNEWELY